MNNLNQNIGGSVNEKHYAPPIGRRPAPWANGFHGPSFGWNWKKALMIAGIVAAIVGLVLLLLYFRYRPARVPEDAVWQYERILNGETQFVKNLAPDQYWNHISAKNGSSKSSEIKDAQEEAHSLYRALLSTYIDCKVHLDVVSQEEIQLSGNKGLTTFLKNYGIDHKTVEACRQLSVQATLVLSDNSGAQVIETYFAIQMDGCWYLICQSATPGSGYFFLFDHAPFPIYRPPSSLTPWMQKRPGMSIDFLTSAIR